MEMSDHKSGLPFIISINVQCPSDCKRDASLFTTLTNTTQISIGERFTKSRIRCTFLLIALDILFRVAEANMSQRCATFACTS